MPFDDVCVFNGQPIAVDGTGRTVTVEPDLSLELVAEAVFDGGKKFLVESDGCEEALCSLLQVSAILQMIAPIDIGKSYCFFFLV
ncbi:uncharacterized protein [Medicago truncatula]|uniref:uncharacterized protein isoform X2 n=1 Tax=Medicago truncatula TaxID=3880 RepID=UPI001967A81C|nr:uncharacterized protein LOC25488831 isoform X2 [Medicago truncatula]